MKMHWEKLIFIMAVAGGNVLLSLFRFSAITFALLAVNVKNRPCGHREREKQRGRREILWTI